MRSRLHLIALLLFTTSTLLAQSYHGVQVGQRGDLLPPAFSEVKRGELDAQFGNERMEVFVNGALVTGFRIFSLVPLTLAEAVAKHGSTGDVDRMQLLLDGDGDPQGIVDPIKRISYITASLDPNAVVTYVGYYDTNGSLLIWTDYADSVFLRLLENVARSASLQDINARPRTSSQAAAAHYMVGQAIKSAQASSDRLNTMFSHYRQSCSNPTSSECSQAKQTQVQPMQQGVKDLQLALKRAEQMFEANAELLHQIRPPDLDRVEQSAVQLLQQVSPIVPIPQ